VKTRHLYLQNVGSIHAYLNNPQESLSYFAQAREMKRVLYTDQPRQDVASLLENMGCAHLCLGNSSKSLPYFEQALEVKKVLYGNKPCEDIAIPPQYIEVVPIYE
jgi:tetratricopeptide (TPR) repeat protein